MSLAGNTSPRRLHRLTSFSIVTAFARSVTASAVFSADKQHPPAVSIFVNAQPAIQSSLRSYSYFVALLFKLCSALLLKLRNAAIQALLSRRPRGRPPRF